MNIEMQGSRYLTIIEVSQKQSYIFTSNRLKNNIIASNNISYVTSPKFFKESFSSIYNEQDNLVYSGGGHIMFTFKTEKAAVAFTEKVSLHVMTKFDGLEVFARTIKCTRTPSEDRKELIKQLEIKKSIRRSGFRQGLFGIEFLKLEDILDNKNEIHSNGKQIFNEDAQKEEEEWIKPYTSVNIFNDLGGSKNISNYIAVVHIDGNQMGKRVGELDEELNNCDFEEYRKARRDFCDQIDRAFKESYQEMLEVVKRQMQEGVFDELELKRVKDENQKLITCNFPIRKIILAGDDVCFVTEGRIGIECAVTFIEKLWEKEPNEGGAKYSACAGVAIVHERYPFSKAYELAEKLCSSAKRKIAEMVPNKEANISSIDWHIERGEILGTMTDIRKHYISFDGAQLEGRPYIIKDDSNLKSGDTHYYCEWKSMVRKLRDPKKALATSKLKGMYHAIKQGEDAQNNYLEFALRTEIDEKEKVYLFDAIEVMDTYIPFLED